jgi:hypothetical protein
VWIVSTTLQEYVRCLNIYFNFGLGGRNSLTNRAKCVKFGVEKCNSETYTGSKKYCLSVKYYKLTTMIVSEVMSDKSSTKEK